MRTSHKFYILIACTKDLTVDGKLGKISYLSRWKKKTIPIPLLLLPIPHVNLI